MTLFLILGALAGVAHDQFNCYLDGRPADGGIFTSFRAELGSFSDQSIANLIANVISKVAGGCFAAAVASALVQLFWGRVRRHPATLTDINSMANLIKNPLDVSSWPAALTLRSLSAVVLAAALMPLISIITPGSVTIESVAYDEHCSYDVVDLHQDNSTTVEMLPRVPTSGLVARTLMAGTYIPPRRLCQACEYNVTFVAPAVQCRNVTQSTNASALVALDSPKYGILGMWSAYPVTSRVARPPDETDYILWLFSRNFPDSSSQSVPTPQDCPIIALKCTGWIAEYNVHVEHGTFSTASVLGVTMRRPLTSNDSDASYFPPPVPDSQVAGF